VKKPKLSHASHPLSNSPTPPSIAALGFGTALPATALNVFMMPSEDGLGYSLPDGYRRKLKRLLSTSNPGAMMFERQSTSSTKKDESPRPGLSASTVSVRFECPLSGSAKVPAYFTAAFSKAACSAAGIKTVPTKSRRGARALTSPAIRTE
jgi:hypothetical protein